MEAFDKVAEMSFHGISYIIKISAKENGLNVEIEEKETGDVWKSSFPASYIEEITQKTGNFKKFDVFAKMLQSAVSKASESVFIDILSAHDLEMMKAKNQKQTVTKPTAVPKNAKRYIILTYSVEYDKVHYPLPLNYEETPNVPALKNTIKQLRSEVETLKTMLNKNSNQNNDGFFMTAMGDAGNTSEVQALKAENEALKERLKKIDDLGGTSPVKLGAVELDILMKSKLDLETELETLKKDYVRDVKRMKAKLEEVDGERKAIFEELTKLKNQAAEQGLIDTTRRNPTASKEESEPSFLKKLMLKHQKEADKYRKEVESFRIMDNKQRARIKQLEMDLQAATRGAGGRNKGASPVYPRQKDLSLRTSDNKRSTSVTKSLSPSFKLTVPNRASAKPMPATTKSMVGSGSMGGNLKQRSQISPLGRSPPVDRRASPPRSNLNDPYSNKRSPLNKPHYLSPLNSKVSPSNKLGGLGYNNYLVNSPNAYGSGSKINEKPRHIQMGGNLDSVKQSLMIMGAGSGPLSSKGDAPGNLSIVSQSNIKHNLQEHYMDLADLKNNKTVEHTSGDPLLNSDEAGGLNRKLNKLQDIFKNVKS